VQRNIGRESCSPVGSPAGPDGSLLPLPEPPVIGRDYEPLRRIRKSEPQVAAAPSHRDTWTDALRRVKPESPRHHAVAPTAQAGGAKVSCSRAIGAQATEVDSVGVHAFAEGNVRTRDPDVDQAEPLPEREVEAFWVSTR